MPEPTPEEIEMMEEIQAEQKEDDLEENFGINQEMMDVYGTPEPEEKVNQHVFIKKSVFDIADTEKVTFLHQGELGTGLFTVRFLLDMEDIAKFYIDDIAIKLETGNGISDYFRKKINNICDSGLSNDGFIQKLNVTRKMDTTRTRSRNLDEVNKKRRNG